MRFSMFAVYCLLVLLAGSMVVASPTNWMIYTWTGSTDGSHFGVSLKLGVKPAAGDGCDGYDGGAVDFGVVMNDVKCSAAMLNGGGCGYPNPWLFWYDMKSTASYTTYPGQEKKWTFFVGGLDQSTGDILLEFRTAGSTQLMVDAQTGDWRFYLRLVDNKGRDVKVPTWAGGDGSASWWVGQAYQIMVPTSTSTYFGPTMLPELRVFGYDNPNMFMSQAYKLEFIQAPAQDDAINLVVNAPTTLAVVNGCYSPDPFQITATTNGAERLELTLPFHYEFGQRQPDLVIANNESDRKTGSSASWFVTAVPYSSARDLSFKVTAYKGTSSEMVTRNIHIPAATADVVLHSPYKNYPNWYLVQTHCHHFDDAYKKLHSIDGSLTPQEVRQKYRDAGYSYTFVTEHNCMNVAHGENSVELSAETHHLIGLDMNKDITGLGPCLGTLDWLWYPSIQKVLDAGGLAIAAHPTTLSFLWKTFYDSWPLNILMGSPGYHAMEIFTASIASWYWPAGTAFGKWDDLLAGRHRVWGVASDDYTPHKNRLGQELIFTFDGGAIDVNASGPFDPRENIRSGNFIAKTGSNGPGLTMSVSGKRITAKTTTPCVIEFIGRGGKVLDTAGWWWPTTEASYDCKDGDTYVRVQATPVLSDHKSWSQPIFVDAVRSNDWVLVGSTGGLMYMGPASMQLPPQQAGTAQLEEQLATAGTFEVRGRTVPLAELPDYNPPWGHIGQPVEFDWGTAIPSPLPTLTLKYDDFEKGPIGAEHLSIYRLDPVNNMWVGLPSTVSTVNHTVSCQTPEPGIFTISGELPTDTTSPTISFQSPSPGAVIEGPTTVALLADDDNGVSEVNLFLDDTHVGSDGSPEDGWTVEFDAGNLPSGFHNLIAAASDASGNKATASLPVTVQGGVTPTVVSIDNPAANSRLSWSVEANGTWSGDGIDRMACLIDGQFLGVPTVADHTWSTLAYLDAIPLGTHQFQVLAIDVHGNSASATVPIEIVSALPISIDIRPGGYPNSINLRSRGVLPVAILTTPTFDANSVNVATVWFAGAQPVHWANQDVDKDGDLDVVCQFRTESLSLTTDSVEGILTGYTREGVPVEGTDSVRIVR